MKRIVSILAIFSFSWLLYAQDIQVPFDELGKITTIDAKLNAKTGLFKNEIGFKSAELFQLNDSTYSLEISYEQNGKMLRRRETIKTTDLLIIRNQLREPLESGSPEYTIDQDGRTTLLVATSASSLILYAPSVIDIFRLSDRPAIATYMFIASAGFVVPFYLTRKEPVTIASAWLSIYGQTRGMIHGLALSSLLDINDRYVLGTASVMSISEGFAGYLYARNKNLSAGSSSAMRVYGDFGSAFGVLAVASTGAFENNNNGNTVAITYLLSNFAGLAYGKYMSDNTFFDTGDSYVLTSTGVLGTISLLTLINIADPNDYKPYTMGAAIGIAGGLYLGNSFVNKSDYKFGQGVLIALGTSAGSLVGLGLGVLATETMNPKILFLSATAGGWAGFFTVKKIFDRQNTKMASHLKLQMNIGPLPYYAYQPVNSGVLPTLKIAPALNFALRF